METVPSEVQHPPKAQHWYKDWRWQVGLAAVLTFLVVVIYGVDWSGLPPKWHKWAPWTGFVEDTTVAERTEKDAKGNVLKITDTRQSGKTLWDWMELLLVPFLLAFLSFQLQQIERERAEKQAEVEREIATANLRDEALQAYLDRITQLLLEKNLRNSTPDDVERDIARVRTSTLLRRLNDDKERKAIVLQFLYGADLLTISNRVIQLEKADFREIKLEKANLKQANLKGIVLYKAILKGANLQEADLKEAQLSGANLGRANLKGADLEGVKNITPGQIKTAENWEKAHYSPDFRQKLGLPPEPSRADKG